MVLHNATSQTPSSAPTKKSGRIRRTKAREPSPPLAALQEAAIPDRHIVSPSPDLPSAAPSSDFDVDPRLSTPATSEIGSSDMKTSDDPVSSASRSGAPSGFSFWPGYTDSDDEASPAASERQENPEKPSFSAENGAYSQVSGTKSSQDLVTPLHDGSQVVSQPPPGPSAASTSSAKDHSYRTTVLPPRFRPKQYLWKNSTTAVTNAFKDFILYTGPALPADAVPVSDLALQSPEHASLDLTSSLSNPVSSNLHTKPLIVILVDPRPRPHSDPSKSNNLSSAEDPAPVPDVVDLPPPSPKVPSPLSSRPGSPAGSPNPVRPAADPAILPTPNVPTLEPPARAKQSDRSKPAVKLEIVDDLQSLVDSNLGIRFHCTRAKLN